jgi:hypothetical protein
LNDCEVPLRLSRWQWVNLYEDNGYQRLIKALCSVEENCVLNEEKIKVVINNTDKINKKSSEYDINKYSSAKRYRINNIKLFFILVSIVFLLSKYLRFYYIEDYKKKKMPENSIEQQQEIKNSNMKHVDSRIDKDNKSIKSPNQFDIVLSSKDIESSPIPVAKDTANNKDDVCTRICAEMREAQEPYLKVINNKKASKDKKAIAEIYLPETV